MKQGEYILLPSDTRLTETGVIYEKKRGNNIPLRTYKIVNIYWEYCEYPFPHSVQRIELKKRSGKIGYIKYMETVKEILSTLTT